MKNIIRSLSRFLRLAIRATIVTVLLFHFILAITVYTSIVVNSTNVKSREISSYQQSGFSRFINNLQSRLYSQFLPSFSLVLLPNTQPKFVVRIPKAHSNQATTTKSAHSFKTKISNNPLNRRPGGRKSPPRLQSSHLQAPFFDIAVIGAGISGLAAAKTIAENADVGSDEAVQSVTQGSLVPLYHITTAPQNQAEHFCFERSSEDDRGTADGNSSRQLPYLGALKSVSSLWPFTFPFLQSSDSFRLSHLRCKESLPCALLTSGVSFIASFYADYGAWLAYYVAGSSINSIEVLTGVEGNPVLFFTIVDLSAEVGNSGIGYTVAVLEGRDRIGGRIRTVSAGAPNTSADSEVADMGATFLHFRQHTSSGIGADINDHIIRERNPLLDIAFGHGYSCHGMPQKTLQNKLSSKDPYIEHNCFTPHLGGDLFNQSKATSSAPFQLTNVDYSACRYVASSGMAISSNVSNKVLDLFTATAYDEVFTVIKDLVITESRSDDISLRAALEDACEDLWLQNDSPSAEEQPALQQIEVEQLSLLFYQHIVQDLQAVVEDVSGALYDADVSMGPRQDRDLVTREGMGVLLRRWLLGRTRPEKNHVQHGYPSDAELLASLPYPIFLNAAVNTISYDCDHCSLATDLADMMHTSASSSGNAWLDAADRALAVCYEGLSTIHSLFVAAAKSSKSAFTLHISVNQNKADEGARSFGGFVATVAANCLNLAISVLQQATSASSLGVMDLIKFGNVFASEESFDGDDTDVEATMKAGLVSVTFNQREELLARKVISTLPIGVLQHSLGADKDDAADLVAFSPPLPTELTDQIRDSLGVSNTLKALLCWDDVAQLHQWFDSCFCSANESSFYSTPSFFVHQVGSREKISAKEPATFDFGNGGHLEFINLAAMGQTPGCFVAGIDGRLADELILNGTAADEMTQYLFYRLQNIKPIRSDANTMEALRPPNYSRSVLSDWHGPFSRGGYAHRRPIEDIGEYGLSTNASHSSIGAIQDAVKSSWLYQQWPVDRKIIFAGEHTSWASYGNMQGALESGTCAARDAIRLLIVEDALHAAMASAIFTFSTLTVVMSPFVLSFVISLLL